MHCILHVIWNIDSLIWRNTSVSKGYNDHNLNRYWGNINVYIMTIVFQQNVYKLCKFLSGKFRRSSIPEEPWTSKSSTVAGIQATGSRTPKWKHHNFRFQNILHSKSTLRWSRPRRLLLGRKWNRTNTLWNQSTQRDEKVSHWVSYIHLKVMYIRFSFLSRAIFVSSFTSAFS